MQPRLMHTHFSRIQMLTITASHIKNIHEKKECVLKVYNRGGGLKIVSIA